MENMCKDEVLQYLRESLPQVLLDLHDIASKKRRQAKLSLRALCDRANTEPELQEVLVSTTVACLAGASETIRAGVVEALGLYAYALEDCEGLKQRFIRIVLLLENHSPQMARSVVKFLRLTIQGVHDGETLNNCFQYFLRTILGSSVARAACRVRIRTLVEKLGKRFGWDNLEKMIPEAHIKLFRYTRRMYNRRVRKCQAKATRDADSEADSSDSSEEEEEVCMVERDDRPVDLASGTLPIIRKRVSRPQTPAKVTAEGKLVVEESDADDEPVARPVKKRVSLADLAELRDRAAAFKKATTAERTASKGISKRKTEELSKSKRNRRKHDLVGLSQYAPKKSNSFGDAKRSAADTDPYAYVRLNPSLVREKFRGNALSTLSQVIRKTGEKAARKRGRSGVSGTLFVQKPVFKKAPVSSGKKGKSVRRS